MSHEIVATSLSYHDWHGKDAVAIKLIDSKHMTTKLSSFVYALWTSQLFIALPFFLIVYVHQSQRGPFTLQMALVAAAIFITATVVFALIMWIVFIEPMRKAKGLR
jgi:hypothetical protein